MLPLISSLPTDFSGLPGDSKADLRVSDESGGPFAGILRQSTAAKPTAVPRMPVGNSLPPDGKLLPLDLQIELPVGDASAGRTAATGSTEPPGSLYGLGLGLAPQPIAAAIANELGEVAELQQPDIEQAVGDRANLGHSLPDAHSPAPIEELVDPAAVSITPQLAPIAEPRSRERGVPLAIERSAGPATARPTDSGSAAVNLLSRGLSPVQSSVAAVSGADLLNQTAGSVPDGPTVAVLAGKVAAEALAGATAQTASGPTDASAALNNSSLPAHVLVAGTASSGPAASTPAASTAMHIGAPLHDAAWSNELGSRVVLMSGQQLQSARIHLSPAELGPITVNLVVDDGSADLTFHAHHVLTRDAIEQALPRLREMLNDSGLTLGNATVSDQGVPQDGSGGAFRETGGADLPASEGSDRETPLTVTPDRVLQGLLDTFV